ncbi:EamA family transporter [Candidatus Woesearchaeota archaeon]|nr:EamA family transporter [Candidatus Woesearchaeota archaeon]
MNQPTRAKAIFLVLFCTLLTSAAQIFWKTGAELLPLLSWQLLAGFVLYAVGAVILIYALSGAPLTIVYPMIATSYIWVSLLAWFLFGEPLAVGKWVGVFSIIAGLFFVGFGGRHD